LGCFGPFFLACSLGVAATIFGFSEPPRWTEWARLVALSGFSCWFALGILSAFSVAGTTIVPYFQRQLGDIHTFARGHEVAKCCQKLDELALRLGLTPLSAFGFNDDFAGEELAWHAPELGLSTVSGLLLALSQGSHISEKREQLVTELTAIEDALRKASDRSVPFCLLVRAGGGTNSMEWEQRKGTCF